MGFEPSIGIVVFAFELLKDGFVVAGELVVFVRFRKFPPHEFFNQGPGYLIFVGELQSDATNIIRIFATGVLNVGDDRNWLSP